MPIEVERPKLLELYPVDIHSLVHKVGVHGARRTAEIAYCCYGITESMTIHVNLLPVVIYVTIIICEVVLAISHGGE